MRLNMIMSFPEAQRCLKESFKFFYLSRYTTCKTLLCFIAFLVSWLTFTGVGYSDAMARATLFLGMYLFIVATVCSCFADKELNRGLMYTSYGVYAVSILFWNYHGHGLLWVLEGLLNHNPVPQSMAFNALSSLLTTNIFLSIVLGHYVYVVALMVLDRFRDEKIMKQGVIQRIVLNFAGQVLQMCVFPSLSILLLLSTPVSIVPALFLPVLLVWNLVYAFIILMKTENGSQPEATIQLIGHANWKWEKSK